MEKVRSNQIATKALQTRKKYLNIGPNFPICPYVLAEAMGFDLRFVNIPSFEGMYVADDHLILISSERPEGRKRFSCAHEIGHHVLGHGTVIDEIIESGSDIEIETEADFFAGILLMPSSAVTSAIRRYGKESDALDREDIYVLSKYFGVSYTAFVTQLFFNLRMINHRRYQYLVKGDLANVRKNLCPIDTKRQIITIGDWWEGRAIDLEEDDFIIANTDCDIDGPKILKVTHNENETVFKALAPGITRIYTDSGWSSFVKVSRRKFQGMFQYKYEEDEE